MIIDDDEDISLSSKLFLKQHYTDTIIRKMPKGLNKHISTQTIDVVVLDMIYKIGFNDGKKGMYWLKHIKSIQPEMMVILMTAYGEVELTGDYYQRRCL